MKFYIHTQNGSGCEYDTKEELLKELTLMINDCIENGGSYISIEAYSDASFYWQEDDKNEDKGMGHG